MKPLILASGSPRRAKILRDLGVDFEIVKTEAAEVSIPHDPVRTVTENACAKLRAAVAQDIYGKPRDLDEAKEFFRELSGQTHVVFTGIAFWDGKGEDALATACVRSEVTFRALSEEMIEEYVARVHPTDRAGAYDIDESGDLIVASYTGSYENIMGLPVEPLRDFGLIG